MSDVHMLRAMREAQGDIRPATTKSSQIDEEISNVSNALDRLEKELDALAAKIQPVCYLSQSGTCQPTDGMLTEAPAMSVVAAMLRGQANRIRAFCENIELLRASVQL